MMAMSSMKPPSSRSALLSGPEFDLLIIGAGIYGATLAFAGSRAGLNVALIEKGDFGEAASANSLKILHGGLRYLQHMDLARMKESIEARRTGLISLPYLAHPATFFAPAGGGLKRSLAAFRIAAKLNDVVSRHRNQGVPTSHHLADTKVLTPAEVKIQFPDAGLPGRGGLMWSDGFIENTERYTLAYVMSARAAGAVTRNYVRALRLNQAGDAISGAVARDELSGEEFNIRAKITVNASGAWLPEWRPGGSASDRTATAMVRAYNIVVRKKWFGPFGVGIDGKLSSGRRRNFFFAPWREGTMIGTVYKPFDEGADACRLTPAEIQEFVQEINQLYPGAGLDVRDVTFAHVGILPGKVGRDGVCLPEPSGKTIVHDLKKIAGISGYLAIQGVKYTTAECWSRRLMAEILNQLNRRATEPAAVPLYGAEQPVDMNDVLDAAAGIGWKMSEEMASWLSGQYGALYREVMELTRDNATWRNSLPGTTIPLAAIVHAVRREDAVHLDDVVFRRTDLGTFAYPGDETITAAAAVMARLLGWDEARIDAELNRVRAQYQRLGITLSP